jgi:uncharacterized protein (TIGR03437 family)
MIVVRVVAISLLCFTAPASAQFTAAPGSPFPAGGAPNSVVAADFTGDGIPDLAIADFSGGTVTVLVGVRGGGFSKGVGGPVVAGSEPVSLAAYSCGTQMCLAVANQGNQTVSILVGDGTGMFNPPATAGSIALKATPVSLAVGTFNGTLWLAVATLGDSNSEPGAVSVFTASGAGPFQAVTGNPWPVGKSPSAVAIADVNGDGLPDLVVTNKIDDTVSVLLGQSAGGFTTSTIQLIPQGLPQPPGPPGAYPNAIVVGDFNGDSKPDLAIANEGTDNIAVLLGDGNGGFAPVPNRSPVPVGSTPFFLATGYFNNDINLDLAVANEGSNSVTVLLGNGAGGFSQAAYNPFTPAAGSPYGTGTSPVSLAVADFNGDGTMDLAVANAGSNTVTVLLNDLYLPIIMVSAADYRPAPVAIGSIVTIFGSGMAAAPVTANSQPLPTLLGQTGVTLTYSTGVQELLPLFYVSPTQINAMVPADAVAGAATATVYTGLATQSSPVILGQTAPALFSANGNGQGVAAAQFVAYPFYSVSNVFQCASVAGTCFPLPLDVSASQGKGQLVLYGTGIRNATPPVMVTVGGLTQPAAYAGAAPGSSGEDQVNVPLPANLPSGLMQVTVTAGGMTSNVVTIYIR